MAALRAAFRTAPRVHLLRPSPGARFAPVAQRRTAVNVIGRREATDQKSVEEAEEASEDLVHDNIDPNMVGWHCTMQATALSILTHAQNGNYPDPSLTSALPLKRQHRDPYADWWDPIERRNYGEPVHEDNDILGIFSTEDYTHFSPARGAFLWVRVNSSRSKSLPSLICCPLVVYDWSFWYDVCTGLPILSWPCKSLFPTHIFGQMVNIDA